jgi:hypothetical protein
MFAEVAQDPAEIRPAPLLRLARPKELGQKRPCRPFARKGQIGQHPDRLSRLKGYGLTFGKELDWAEKTKFNHGSQRVLKEAGAMLFGNSKVYQSGCQL